MKPRSLRGQARALLPELPHQPNRWSFPLVLSAGLKGMGTDCSTFIGCSPLEGICWSLLGAPDICRHGDKVRKKGLTAPCRTALTKPRTRWAHLQASPCPPLRWREAKELHDLPKTTGQCSDSNPVCAAAPGPNVSSHYKDFLHLRVTQMAPGAKRLGAEPVNLKTHMLSRQKPYSDCHRMLLHVLSTSTHKIINIILQ